MGYIGVTFPRAPNSRMWVLFIDIGAQGRHCYKHGAPGIGIMEKRMETKP